MSDFTVRPARDGDGKALTELAAAAADTGAVRIAPHYLHDPLETSRVLRPDAEWAIAETEDGRVIGAGTVDFGDVEIEGEVCRGARLSNLMVDLNPSNVKLRDRAVRIVRELTGADEAAAKAALEKSGWVVKAALKRLKQKR